MIGAYDDDDLGTDAGAAYVYKYHSSTGEWNQTQKLLANDGAAYDYFGYSVGISADWVSGQPPKSQILNDSVIQIVVGAYGESSSAGAAYLFEYSSTLGRYNQTQKVVSSVTGSFALAVAIYDTTVRNFRRLSA